MFRLDHTRGSAKDQVASAESEREAANGESLARGGEFPTSGRFALNRGLSATDGPFAETKEALGGSIRIDARDQDAVIDVVSKIPPAWPGTIEVRSMMAIEAHERGRTPGLRRPLLDATGPLYPRCSTPSSGGPGRGPDRHAVRVYQTACAVCGLPLAAGGSVLFQGDHLVHATCWRADPQPLRVETSAPPRAARLRLARATTSCSWP
jgi:hypothetical protein